MRAVGQDRRRSPWAVVALAGQLAWMGGNLYEGVVGVPELLSDAHEKRAPGLLRTGSPVRFYAPLAPLVLGATGVTLVKGWQVDDNKRLIVAAAASNAVALALSGYLIREVNLPLLRSADSLPTSGRLIRIWHRTNAVRLIAIISSVMALSRLGWASSAGS